MKEKKVFTILNNGTQEPRMMIIENPADIKLVTFREIVLQQLRSSEPREIRITFLNKKLLVIKPEYLINARKLDRKKRADLLDKIARECSKADLVSITRWPKRVKPGEIQTNFTPTPKISQTVIDFINNIKEEF